MAKNIRLGGGTVGAIGVLEMVPSTRANASDSFRRPNEGGCGGKNQDSTGVLGNEAYKAKVGTDITSTCQTA